MKSIGIVRKLDDLGRYVVPKEVRRGLGWTSKTPIEAFVEGDKVILQEYKVGCMACGEVGNTTRILNFEVCNKCKEYIKKALEV